jgi:hypothetical protein
MASTTCTSLDDDDREGHHSFFRGVRNFISQFIAVAFRPSDDA